jgi:PAS domain S-box-containing protein
LRRSEERLRLVQEATGLADFEAGPEGVTWLSPTFIEQTGLPPNTTHVPISRWLEIVHPEDRERYTREIAASLSEGHPFQSEFRIVRPNDGEVRWIFARTKVERNAAGRAIRSIGAHLDITRQKLNEEALRESEERFRLAAEAAGLGVWDYDALLDQREWSDRLREILGIAPDAEPSLDVAEACIHPADRARFTRQLQTIRTGQTDQF